MERNGLERIGMNIFGIEIYPDEEVEVESRIERYPTESYEQDIELEIGLTPLGGALLLAGIGLEKGAKKLAPVIEKGLDELFKDRCVG